MADFKCLERLILEHNRFANNDILFLLSLIPKLRHCSLAHNFLTTIPPESCQNEGFRCLDTLDISFNYLSREEDLMPLVNLYRIESVMCYGNPLLGNLDLTLLIKEVLSTCTI